MEQRHGFQRYETRWSTSDDEYGMEVLISYFSFKNVLYLKNIIMKLLFGFHWCLVYEFQINPVDSFIETLSKINLMELIYEIRFKFKVISKGFDITRYIYAWWKLICKALMKISIKGQMQLIKGQMYINA